MPRPFASCWATYTICSSRISTDLVLAILEDGGRQLREGGDHRLAWHGGELEALVEPRVTVLARTRAVDVAAAVLIVTPEQQVPASGRDRRRTLPDVLGALRVVEAEVDVGVDDDGGGLRLEEGRQLREGRE
eukprot:scaffold36301_cov57-Phaeocystis_antarctica.AAC.1